ncbi:sigma-70 family RNA polymerase sigma factor [Lentzea sp. NPDC006480]|uniref:sigma-70 family RNA polymerase sigma factor n=1 Tax=Lentzea sp. NPDC006480 TaxID=3157176 RepID=UPI0033BB7004
MTVVRIPSPRTLEADVLAELYRLHGHFLKNYLRHLTTDAHVAEDILQETFLRAWKTPRLVDKPETCRPWLVTVARNLVVDRIRYRTRRPRETGDAALPHIAQPHCEMERVVTSLTLGEAMAKLTPNRREVVVHMYLHDRSPDEIADFLGIPVGTVKSRANSALRALRSHICPAA